MSYEYDQYLINHRESVAKGFYWIRDNIPEVLAGDEWELERQIFYHDDSKNHLDEYEAYDKYFYGKNRSHAVVTEFNLAWLRHIHQNPHHWQHWVLINDNPNEGKVVMDMSYKYIVEMLCDWWAFSWDKGNLHEIFSWYDDHKDYMQLSDKTRKTVESILDKIKVKLDEVEKEKE